jgi:hypothetical protein
MGNMSMHSFQSELNETNRKCRYFMPINMSNSEVVQRQTLRHRRGITPHPTFLKLGSAHSSDTFLPQTSRHYPNHNSHPPSTEMSSAACIFCKIIKGTCLVQSVFTRRIEANHTPQARSLR